MNRIVVALSAFLVLAAGERLTAGTVMVGAKTWYSVWDSAMAKTYGVYFSDYLETYGPDGTANNGDEIPNSIAVNPGTGYLAGPLAGYQSEDGKWSVSMAYMFLNGFSQSTSVDASGTAIDINMDMERRDFDLSAGYSLMANLKIFVGYKWMYTKFDNELEIGGVVTDLGWYEVVSQMPGVGIGTVYPLSEKFLLSGQLGVLLVMSDMQYSSGYNYNVANTWGFNFEVAANYLITENILLQAGGRYQTFLLKIDDPVFTSEQTDTFIGFTLSAIYLF